MNKQILIFDLDDTLLDFKAGEAIGLKRVFDHFKTAALDYETWFTQYQEINQLTWKKIEQGMAPQPLLDRRFSDTFAYFDQKTDGIQAEQFYRQQLDQNDALIPRAKTLVKRLVENGYRLVAGTNGKTATQYNRLELTGLTAYFEHIVISDEIGVAKPSPDFFQHIFALYPDLMRDDFLMIGDSLRSDILGAQQALIDSIWICPTPQHTSAILPTYTVRSLVELEQLLLA
ncbi:YjjG family noncanonical pyrimidine nucleotidase [uncultured Enterococcus sp.]|uniref:YjjG family noncanonical pyrimidine nucleotidase n=1 Tax=uncultured Enterococcus sp. TaxID=167972 RepID=UPI0025F2E243|nr:YjjG family noncanonical pyrimidine nucleotidase [uncultured Enterococcus sp.]